MTRQAFNDPTDDSHPLTAITPTGTFVTGEQPPTPPHSSGNTDTNIGVDTGTSTDPRTGRRLAWISSGALLAAAIVMTTMITTVTSTQDGTGVDTGTLTGETPGQQRGSSPWVNRTRVDGLLNGHAAALLRGDEQGWLDVADPTRPDIVDWYRQLYTTLRALQVTWFDYRVPPAIADGRPGPRPETVHIRYCLANVACSRDSSHASTPLNLQFTERNGRWWVSNVPDRADHWQTAVRPPPWLVDPLQVSARGPVIVAAPPALAGRIDAVTAAAVRATTIVNRYARPGITPPTYLIYLAGQTQWDIWYDGHSRTGRTQGVAVSSSSIQTAIVVRMDRIDAGDLDQVLTHEMGHVVTMFGEPDDTATPPPSMNGWIAEGIAEYIAWTGQPPARYPRLDSVHRYVRAGRWNGTLPVHIDYTDDLGTDATYGLNYLIVRYLADRFGEAALLRLVDDLLRNNTPIQHAARPALGQTWTALAADLANHLRQTMR